MMIVIVKYATAQEVRDALEESDYYHEVVGINGLFDADKVEFLIDNIDKIDIDQLKSLVK